MPAKKTINDVSTDPLDFLDEVTQNSETEVVEEDKPVKRKRKSKKEKAAKEQTVALISEEEAVETEASCEGSISSEEEKFPDLEQQACSVIEVDTTKDAGNPAKDIAELELKEDAATPSFRPGVYGTRSYRRQKYASHVRKHSGQ